MVCVHGGNEFLPLVAIQRARCREIAGPVRVDDHSFSQCSRAGTTRRGVTEPPGHPTFCVPKSMPKSNPLAHTPGIVSQALHTLVSQIPTSLEVPGADPGERVKSIAKTAALKAAAISGSFTLPPGPLGMATVLPDLLAVWRVQQQLVADIAGAFGRTGALTPETMVICLFKHGGAALTKGLFARQGKDVVVQRIANRTLLQLLEKIGVRVAQRIAAKSLSRWLPILGAIGAGAYAYYDTTHVAANAIDLFSQSVRIDEGNSLETPAAERKPARRRARASTKAKPSTSKAASKAAPTKSKSPRRTRKTSARSQRPPPGAE